MYKKLRGFNDWYYEKANDFFFLKNKLLIFFILRDYSFVELPIVENLDLFKRTIGVNNEIVNKEMFFLKPKKENREWVLRPEITAQVARMFLENKLDKDISKQTQKFCYFGPMFRYERPQHNRYRQFYSFGVEFYYQKQYVTREYALLEILDDLKSFFKDNQIILLYNWLPQNIDKYTLMLKDFFKSCVDKLCHDCQSRYQKNVLRILDCKDEGCYSKTLKIPNSLQFLNEEEIRILNFLKSHFRNSQTISYQYDPYLVRGIDYYKGFVFEIVLVKNNKKDLVSCLGGGEYNDLLSQMGDKEINWNVVGFGIGFERLLTLKIKNPNPLNSLVIVTKEFNNKLFELRKKLLSKGKYIVTIRFSKKNFGRDVEWAKKQGFSYIVNYKSQQNLDDVFIIRINDFHKEKLNDRKN